MFNWSSSQYSDIANNSIMIGEPLEPGSIKEWCEQQSIRVIDQGLHDGYATIPKQSPNGQHMVEYTKVRLYYCYMTDDDLFHFRLWSSWNLSSV